MALCPDDLTAALKAMTVDTASPGVAKQAEQIWRMLDSMAENNPGEYEAFVSKQLKQGSQEAAKAKGPSKDSLHPALIVHIPTSPCSKAQAASGPIDLSSIVKSSSEKAGMAVISLFEMASAPAAQVNGKIWEPQEHPTKELALCSINFKVLRALTYTHKFRLGKDCLRVFFLAKQRTQLS
jgi:hypothetical protein